MSCYDFIKQILVELGLKCNNPLTNEENRHF